MTADPVTIRTATTADAAAIASVLADAFVEFRDFYTPDGYRATTLAREEVERRFADGPIWVAEFAGQVAGTVSAVVRPDGVHVRSMAVGRSARGCGIGRLLLNQVHEFAAEQDRSHLYLSTTPFLSSAIQLYNRAGFIPTSAPPYELHGTPLFTMEKWSKGVDVR
jgi:putative acetyltransferase